MKKFLSVILAVIMLLSFAACGNSEEPKEEIDLEELLVAEKWINIYNRYDTLEFDIGNYGESEIGYSAFEWKAIDNESVEGYSTYDGDRIFKYVLAEFEGVKALYNPARKEYFVQESVYDGIRENLVFPAYKAYGIVSMKNGNKDIITANELHYIEETNYNNYKEQYLDAKVTVVGEITKINSKSVTIGEYLSYPNCWTIHDLNLNYDLSEFEIGDVVVATGIIEREFASYVDVGENTTIKHYEG